MQPELSKRLFRLIKTENHIIGAYENASRGCISVASQLSSWGESTGDDAVSELSDKLGVLLAEIGEQEEVYARDLEEHRGVLKQIRNTEGSVQPSRDHKTKVLDEIQKLKYKDPQSPKLVLLEQELVRAEAENLVAEAQLTNTTRQKLKEAYDRHFAATIERAEKQAILAAHGRRLLNLLDDTPVIPGEARPIFDGEKAARDILNDAEEELRDWQPNLEPVESSATMIERNMMTTVAGSAAAASVASSRNESPTGSRVTSASRTAVAEEDIHPALRKGSASQSPPPSSSPRSSPGPPARSPPTRAGTADTMYTEFREDSMNQVERWHGVKGGARKDSLSRSPPRRANTVDRVHMVDSPEAGSRYLEEWV
ncbi:MAG: hypothetical protein M1840_005660 [Geoglossum simile]|nr:MAG: hypothetical protein M1840_005660 [Geoglossum simile]